MPNPNEYLNLIIIVVLVVLALIALSSPSSKTRGRQALDKAESRGPVMYFSKNEGVMAVCTREAFEVALREHKEFLGAGSINSWDKVVLKPKATFTFSLTQPAHRPVHTGTARTFEHRVLPGLFRHVTGFDTFDPDVVRQDFLVRIRDALLHEDSRLFVPYSSNRSDFPLKDQHHHYGETTVAQLRKALGLEPQ